MTKRRIALFLIFFAALLAATPLVGTDDPAYGPGYEGNSGFCIVPLGGCGRPPQARLESSW